MIVNVVRQMMDSETVSQRTTFSQMGHVYLNAVKTGVFNLPPVTSTWVTSLQEIVLGDHTEYKETNQFVRLFLIETLGVFRCYSQDQQTQWLAGAELKHIANNLSDIRPEWEVATEWLERGRMETHRVLSGTSKSRVGEL